MTRPTLATAASSGITGRREWLVGAARWTAASLLVGGGAYLSLGRRGAGVTCPRPVCQRCAIRATCRLPAAQSYREAQGRGDHHGAGGDTNGGAGSDTQHGARSDGHVGAARANTNGRHQGAT